MSPFIVIILSRCKGATKRVYVNTRVHNFSAYHPPEYTCVRKWKDAAVHLWNVLKCFSSLFVHVLVLDPSLSDYLQPSYEPGEKGNVPHDRLHLDKSILDSK